MLKTWNRLMLAIILTIVAAVLIAGAAILAGLGVAGKEVYHEIRNPPTSIEAPIQENVCYDSYVNSCLYDEGIFCVNGSCQFMKNPETTP